MNWLTRKVSVFWLYPFGIFAAICLLPWWESKDGNLLPLATAYVNDFTGWQFLLLWHLAATIVFSIIAIGLHLWIARLAKRPP
jgi:hypothetical protein